MRQTVTDPWGSEWWVRARFVRGAGLAPPHPGPDANRLRRRLEEALGRHPAPLVASAPTDVRLPAAPISDPVDAELAALRGEWHRTGSAIWALHEARRSRPRPGALAQLRAWRSGRWEIELVARGRFRRWARWQGPGEQASREHGSGEQPSAEVLAAVAAAVAAGRVPDPAGVALVEVVDHRPPVRAHPVP
ncbi:hypothetical protein JKP75_11475 [Blastococcus sp. TML/M2B]|uniref:hypothetical protein n=1 Tax=unclassified Blastococcus TaxID=2619396 RepID=UPI00190B8C0D|nr:MULTISPECIES: hypothetical protein [unclassified Blastococcus]MBN1093118.1 hypothetical protein [Blastococcus sp. TML/M2B]MBN1096760.1 hypothetical protein [Blastococcus sp. TML/C7B]